MLTVKNKISFLSNTSYKGKNDHDTDESIIKFIESGMCEAIKILLDNKYSVNQHLNTGWTLLMYAASFSQVQVVQQLLNYGGDLNLHHEGNTPLMVLSCSSKGNERSRLECLKYLLDANADVNATNKLKETALMFASKCQHPNFVIKLLNHGANIDTINGQAWTALFYAVASNRLENVRVLVSRGANITLKNYDSLNAYDIAIAKGHKKLIPILDKTVTSESKNISLRFSIQWSDLFSKLTKILLDEIDSNVESLLCGMRLSCYKNLFCSIDLATFLKLTNKDLSRLGIGLILHRNKFIHSLIKFHKQEWSSDIMKINNTTIFTTFCATKVLGNIYNQVCIVFSCLHLFENHLDVKLKNCKTRINCYKKNTIRGEIRTMQVTVIKMQNLTIEIQKIIKNFKTSPKLTLPIFIQKKKNSI